MRAVDDWRQVAREGQIFGIVHKSKPSSDELGRQVRRGERQVARNAVAGNALIVARKKIEVVGIRGMLLGMGAGEVRRQPQQGIDIRGVVRVPDDLGIRPIFVHDHYDVVGRENGSRGRGRRYDRELELIGSSGDRRAIVAEDNLITVARISWQWSRWSVLDRGHWTRLLDGRQDRQTIK